MMYYWTIAGAVLLAGVIIWAMLHNKQSRRQHDRTEAATHELYQEEDAKNKAEGR
jgi:hypothetical protein